MEKKNINSNKDVNQKEIEREIAKVNNDNKTKLFLFVIFTLFILYVVGFIGEMLGRDKTPSTKVLSGSIDLPEFIEGVIIRDETLYEADIDGQITYFYNNLEKIRVGVMVANITANENIVGLKEDISKIDEDILKYQKMRGNELSLAQKDAEKINKDVKNTIDESISSFAEKDVNNLYSIKNDIDKKVNLRNKLLIEETQTSTNDERTHAYNELDNNENNIVVNEGGIISYYFDELENIYTIGNMDNLLEEEVYPENKEKEFIPISSNVVKGNNIFKIVNSNDWYIGAYIENDKVKDWKEGMTRNIYVENDNSYDRIDVTIKSIKQTEDTKSVRDVISSDKKAYVVFKTNKGIIDYIDKRFIKFKTSENEKIGLKIPNTAIIEETILEIPKEYLFGDRESLIKVEKANGELVDTFVSIRKELNDEVMIVQRFGEVELNSKIIHPENENSPSFQIENYEVINGVYKINSGIAKFIQVNLDDEKDILKDFIILNPYKNQTLKSHDFIATYGNEINEWQKIYKK